MHLARQGGTERNAKGGGWGRTGEDGGGQKENKGQRDAKAKTAWAGMRQVDSGGLVMQVVMVVMVEVEGGGGQTSKRG